MNFTKLIAPLTLVSLTALSGAALAADLTGTAKVNLLTPLALSETTQIDFGTMTSEDGTCTMASGGALAGTSGQSCTGSATPGVFKIDGSDVTVDISVTAGAAVDGVTFTPSIDGASSVTLSGGTANVDVIGGLALVSATSGSKSISYTFTANYQ